MIKRADGTVIAPTIDSINVIHAGDVSIVFTAVADNGNKSLNITVADPGEAGVVYRFVVTIHVTQVSFST